MTAVQQGRKIRATPLLRLLPLRRLLTVSGSRCGQNLHFLMSFMRLLRRFQPNTRISYTKHILLHLIRKTACATLGSDSLKRYRFSYHHCQLRCPAQRKHLCNAAGCLPLFTTFKHNMPRVTILQDISPDFSRTRPVFALETPFGCIVTEKDSCFCGTMINDRLQERFSSQ